MATDRAIHDVVEQLGARWNAFDAHGLASLFAQDADLTNAFGVAATGRDAIERFHASLFKSVFNGSHFHVEATRLRWIRPDVVLADVRWSVTGMAAREGLPRADLNGLMAMILTPDSEQWRITTMHVMQFPPGEPSVAGVAPPAAHGPGSH
jgi:uncharacterized protein (TIGR02246 family)